MGEYIAVYIPSPKITGPPTGGVFTSLQEAAKCANTPEAKAAGGGRFKRFTSPEAAQAYAKHGNDSKFECSFSLLSPGESSSLSDGRSLNTSFTESISTYPSVTPIILNRLRKAIETKDNKVFENYVKENPRCLINTGSDKPTIVFEGCRYNALHIAAKCGNSYVVQFILKFISDYDCLLDVYGTSVEDVKTRSRALLDSYLNTPDKGAGDTPLHFASKFGHAQIVKILLSYEQTEKNRQNNDLKTAADVSASRYNGANKAEIRNAILLHFSSVYVPLYRPIDNSSSGVICAPGSYPSRTFTKLVANETQQSLCTEYVISAIAGPFNGVEKAQKFYKEWVTKERDKRLRDPVKGAEEVGRNLSKAQKVKWQEKWPFSQQLLDLNTYEGLTVLNAYLLDLRKRQICRDDDVLKDLDAVKKCLTFDDEDDAILDDDFFVDAKDNIEKGNRNKDTSEADDLSWKTDSFDSSDSVNFITRRVEALKLDDNNEENHNSGDRRGSSIGIESRHPENINYNDLKKGSLKRDCPEPKLKNMENSTIGCCEEFFYTPPTSPKPLYISNDILTKDDEDLLNALNLVDAKLVDQFITIKEYMRKIKKIPAAERAHLPYADSPRAKAKRNFGTVKNFK